MTRSDIMRRALCGAVDVPVPAAPLYLSLYFEPLRRLKLAEVYREMAGGRGELRLSYEDELQARLEAWRRAWASLPSRPHWMPLVGCPSRAALEGARVVVDEQHCLWYAPVRDTPETDYSAPSYNHCPGVWEPAAPPTTIDGVRAALPRWRAEQWLPDEWRTLLLQEFGQEQLCYASCGSPFWSGYSLFGFAGFMQNLRLNPEPLLAASALCLENTLQYAQAMRQLGIECMFVEECFSGSDLISGEDYRRFCWPYLRDLLAELKQLGFLVVFYHTGGIDERLELLARSAADALAFEESKKGFSIEVGEIRRAIGPEKVLFGNTDVVLLRDGNEQQFEADVRQQYEQAGSRYIASTGSPLTLDTPPEKLSMFVEAVGRVTR